MNKTDTIACIRSLLTSTTESYNLKSLLDDFKVISGCDLPVFEYKTPVEFLQSIPDTVKFEVRSYHKPPSCQMFFCETSEKLSGNEYNPKIYPVKCQKSAPISAVVSRQRRKEIFHCCKYRYKRSVISNEKEEKLSQCKENETLISERVLFKKPDYPKLQNQMLDIDVGCQIKKNNDFHILENKKKSSLNENFEISSNKASYGSLILHASYNDEEKLDHNALENKEYNIITTKNECVILNISENPQLCNNVLTRKPLVNYSSSSLSSIGDDDNIWTELSEKSSSVKSCNSLLISSSYITDNMKNKLRQIIKKYPDGLWCSDLPNLFLNEFNQVLDHKEFGCTSLIQMIAKLPDVFRFIRPGFGDWVLFDASEPPGAEEKKMEVEQLSKNIPSDIKKNLRKLLLALCDNDTDDGIELDDLLFFYKEMFGCYLNFKALGFQTLRLLLESLDGNILRLSEANNNLTVRPIISNFTQEPVKMTQAVLSITPDCDFFIELFPKDVVGPGLSLPELNLKCHIKAGDQVEVCVGDVWSPAKFYLQLKKFEEHLKKFMDDLQKFYEIHMNKYKMPDSTITPEQVCIALYSPSPEEPEEWYRAYILKVINENLVSVYMVDYGTVTRIKKQRLRFLHRCFASFPAQAVLAKLHGVVPLGNSKEWPLSISIKFLNLLKFDYFLAQIVDVDYKGRFVSVVLYNIKKKKRINLNKKLVKDNLAKAENLEKSKSCEEEEANIQKIIEDLTHL